MLFGDLFGQSIFVLGEHDVLAKLGAGFHGAKAFAVHGFQTLPFWLAMAGMVLAWYLYWLEPETPAKIAAQFKALHSVLENKYGFDSFNERFFAGGTRGIGSYLWRVGDATVIDGLIVNGSARVVDWFSGRVRLIQTGLLYTYAFVMVIGLLVLIFWFVH
jgi:NADH-quinone oxidoreductase subunit L